MMRMTIFFRAMAVLAFVPAVYGEMPAFAANEQPAVDQTTRHMEVVITARQFRPSQLSFPVDREARLVFVNQDTELHAFVPLTFLENVPLHVDGNGAPQFGNSGLVRVLIPSGGRAEIRFVPRTKGVYQYRCDLPGHQMMGKIVVEDSMGGARRSSKIRQQF